MPAARRRGIGRTPTHREGADPDVSRETPPRIRQRELRQPSFSDARRHMGTWGFRRSPRHRQNNDSEYPAHHAPRAHHVSRETNCPRCSRSSTTTKPLRSSTCLYAQSPIPPRPVSLSSPYCSTARPRTSATAVASPLPAAFCATRYPSSTDPSTTSTRVTRPRTSPTSTGKKSVPHVWQVEQLRESPFESCEELIISIRHGRREADSVLALERQQSRSVLRTKWLELRHRR